VEIGDFLFRQSDIGSNAGIVLMNDANDSGLLRAHGQRLDSVLFSQSDNRHITTNLKSGELFLASGQKSLSLTLVLALYGMFEAF
jgi:hypothetical protein